MIKDIFLVAISYLIIFCLIIPFLLGFIYNMIKAGFIVGQTFEMYIPG